MVDLVNTENDNNITNSGIHPSFVSNNFSNILDEKRAASSFKNPTKSTISPNNNQQNKTQTELHSYTPSIFDTPKEVLRAFDISFTKKITDFQEKYRNADDKIMRAVIKFSTDETSRDETINNWVNSAKSTYSGAQSYSSASINNPAKPFTDVANISLEISQNLGDSIKKKREAYYEAKQYGGVPTFIGENASNSLALGIGVAAAFTPAGKTGRVLTNMWGEEIKTPSTPSNMITKGQNTDYNIYKDNPKIAKLLESSIDTDYGAPFLGVVNTKDEMYQLINDNLTKTHGFIMLSPNINKTGLVEYLTKAGDVEGYLREYTLGRFRYNLGSYISDKSNRFEYSPTILYTSDGIRNADHESLFVIAKKNNVDFRLTWHNHPQGDPMLSASDLKHMRVNKLKSTMISYLDIENQVETNRYAPKLVNLSDDAFSFEGKKGMKIVDDLPANTNEK